MQTVAAKKPARKPGKPRAAATYRSNGPSKALRLRMEAAGAEPKQFPSSIRAPFGCVLVQDTEVVAGVRVTVGQPYVALRRRPSKTYPAQGKAEMARRVAQASRA